MKKKISILLVMMMTLAMFTACGSNAGSNADADMDDAYLDLGPEYIGTENSQNSNVNGSGSNTSKAALEGVYWLHEDDVFRTGFYMDGNGKFIEMRNYDVVEGTYEMVSVYEVPEGIEYEIMRHLGGTVETIFYLISTDGKIEQEPFVYSVVDEKTFYAKEEETTPNSGQGQGNENANTNTNGIAGVYWVTYDAYGEGDKQGFYVDGNGKYIRLYTDGTIREFSYKEITTNSVSDGIEYMIYGDDMGGMAYILGNDGNVYYDWDDGWSGGRDTYVAVSESEFYGN